MTAIPERLQGARPEEALAWAVETFGRGFVVVTALQVEGIVVLDMARRIDPGVRALTVDTGRLPQETHEFLDTVRARLDVRVEVVLPDPDAVAAMVGRHGTNLFRRDQALRRLCCQVRKVDPLARALAGVDAWASGLRRDGGPARAGTAVAERDDAHGGIVKLNPLAAWTRADALAYAREHRLPLHPLYEQGFASIGCAPCTRAVAPGEDERAGRWWWEAGADRECGLHHQSPSARFDAALGQLRADLADRDAPAAGPGRAAAR
ncbi:MAG TPA: phosphoadenylyl-sulfate reductase [Actinomycetes bacterium]|nr:phosphoadenylyl-sulfate reductase [Actinomycetes bacterium]